MQALLVIDAQNEFGPGGMREVPGHAAALQVIRDRIDEARHDARPIAFVRHHNVGPDVDAFVPGGWGAQFSSGIGPVDGQPRECEFVKEVIGAFTGTGLEGWLRSQGCDEVLLVGFFAQICLSTSAREAFVRGFGVSVDPDATGSLPLSHPLLGEQSAQEVKRSALLHLAGLGVSITQLVNVDSSSEEAAVPSNLQPVSQLDHQVRSIDRSVV